MNINWKDGEFGYCQVLLISQGDTLVGSHPKAIARYLRLQASSAFKDGEFEIAARLGQAATCLNEDARNNHDPDWKRAEQAMTIE